MIIIPMLGKSSRFFKNGYDLPKYQLPLGDETVFAHSVRSFEQHFTDKPFLFLVRNDFGARAFVSREAARMGIVDFRVIEFDFETRGQAESVYLGLRDYDQALPFVVFNIDTIRVGFRWPAPADFAQGFLEVFEAEGDGWSFVEPVAGTALVKRTTEKDRISSLCSNGMYGFGKIQDFRDAYEAEVRAGSTVNGEIYIAPLYNRLIGHGKEIRFDLLASGVTLHCGVPADYEGLKERLAAKA
jgi:hypothetical protein